MPLTSLIAARECAAGGALPDFASLPEIPKNLTVAATPGTDPGDEPFNGTCSPSPVHVIQGCYLWCEIPQRYYGNGGDKGSADDAIHAFQTNYGAGASRLNTTGKITGYRKASGGPGRAEVSAKMLGTWFLVVSGVLMYAV